MNLMEHEVMAAPIGAEAAEQTIEKARTKIIDAAPLMERLKAAIAFGNEKGLSTDELEQVLADIEGMEELPPAQPKIIDGRLFVTVDDIKKVGCVLVDEHKNNFCRQFWMDGDGPAPCEDAVSREAVLDALRTCYDTETITYDNGDEYIHYGDAVGEVEQLPPAQPKQPKKTLYKHFKGGIYELIAPRAMNTEGNEIYTIYRSVKSGTVWVRPYDMFFGNVVNDKDEIVPRFVLYQPQEEQQEGDAE